MNYDLLKERGRNIRLHGNRFIQIDLDDEGLERVHVWSDFVPIAQHTPTPIHDHAFDFRSRVLAGTLINVEYDIQPAVGTGAIYNLWVAKPRDREDTELVRLTDEGFWLLQLAARAYDKGYVYWQRGDVLHSTGYIGCAVTHVTKTAQRLGYQPRIAVRVGRSPDNSFNRYQYSPEMLWHTVYRVFKQEGLA